MQNFISRNGVFPTAVFSAFLVLAVLLSVIIVSDDIFAPEIGPQSPLTLDVASVKLSSATLSAFIQSVIVTISAFFMFPRLLFVPVLIYRGLSLGLTAGGLVYGNISFTNGMFSSSVTTALLAVLYFFSSVLILVMCCSAERFSSRLITEKYTEGIGKYLLKQGAVSGMIFLTSFTVSLIR